jgi:hypothetical protein
MKIFVVKNQQLLGSLIEENGNIKFILLMLKTSSFKERM